MVNSYIALRGEGDGTRNPWVLSPFTRTSGHDPLVLGLTSRGADRAPEIVETRLPDGLSRLSFLDFTHRVAQVPDLSLSPNYWNNLLPATTGRALWLLFLWPQLRDA